VAEEMGIGYEAVRARRPNIIYCSINTYGESGPCSGRPGHESIAQAVSGMMVRYGDEKPVNAPYNANDYGTGLLACYGVTLALLHRRRTGKGQRVDSALAYTATLLQSALLHDYDGKRWDEASGQHAVGENLFYRAYQAQDGWLFLAARPGELERCPELADVVAGDNKASVEQALEARFHSRSVVEWVALLTQADIPAHRIVSDPAALMEDPLVRAQGLSITRVHDEIGAVTTTAPAIRMSQTPLVIGRPAPKPGADAAGILEEIGLGDQLDRLVRKRVIVVAGVGAA